MNTNDFQAVGRLLSNDYVLEWPQSGETIAGRDIFAQINERYPAVGAWRFTVYTLVAEGERVVSDVGVTDGMVEARVITFSTVARGEITRQLEFWPDPFEAPEWRRTLTQPL